MPAKSWYPKRVSLPGSILPPEWRPATLDARLAGGPFREFSPETRSGPEKMASQYQYLVEELDLKEQYLGKGVGS